MRRCAATLGCGVQPLRGKETDCQRKYAQPRNKFRQPRPEQSLLAFHLPRIQPASLAKRGGGWHAQQLAVGGWLSPSCSIRGRRARRESPRRRRIQTLTGLWIYLAPFSPVAQFQVLRMPRPACCSLSCRSCGTSGCHEQVYAEWQPISSPFLGHEPVVPGDPGEFCGGPRSGGDTLLRLGVTTRSRCLPGPRTFTTSRCQRQECRMAARCHKQFIPEVLNRFGLVAGQNQYDAWHSSHWKRTRACISPWCRNHPTNSRSPWRL